jgi:hypothetical protein
MRTAMLAACALLFVLALARVASINSSLDELEHTVRRQIDMGSITFTTTINGTTYSRTYVQHEGESDADFEARALAAWAEFLARIGR